MEGLDDSDDNGSCLEVIKQNSAEKGKGNLNIRHRYEQYSYGFCFQEECTVIKNTVKIKEAIAKHCDK